MQSNGRQPFGTSNHGNRIASAQGKSKATPIAKPSYQPPTSAVNKKALGSNIGMGYPSSAQRAATRTQSENVSAVTAPAKMAAKKGRQSFRPRPSLDAGVFGMGGMPNLGRAPSRALDGVMIKEEPDDDY